MNILLTNDDGFDAKGIVALQKALLNAGHNAIIVAPKEEKSATSHSLSVFNPLIVKQKAEKVYAVNGFPADCAVLGYMELFGEKIDLVISGINSGPNMGEDVLYSGTVSGAIEAMHLGLKAIAVSIDDYENQAFDEAAKVVVNLINKKIVNLINDEEILNINIPNLPENEIKGIKATIPGHREYRDFVTPQTDPRGRKFYWIGGQRPIWDLIEGTDCHALKTGYVSITPLKPNFYKPEAFAKIDDWAKK